MSFLLCICNVLGLCRIMKVDLSFPSTPYVSSEAKHLISRVSSYLHFQRRFGQLVLLLTAISKLMQLLVKDSSRRLSLQRIMEHPWIIKNANPIGVCS